MTSKYWYCFPGVAGFIGPTRSQCNLSRGFLVLMGPMVDFGEGGFIAFHFSHASHLGGIPAFFGYSGRF